MKSMKTFPLTAYLFSYDDIKLITSIVREQLENNLIQAKKRTA